VAEPTEERTRKRGDQGGEAKRERTKMLASQEGREAISGGPEKTNSTPPEENWNKPSDTSQPTQPLPNRHHDHCPVSQAT
jgi:hypothetical protein